MANRVVNNLNEFTEWVEEVGDAFTDNEGFAAPWFRASAVLNSSWFQRFIGQQRVEKSTRMTKCGPSFRGVRYRWLRTECLVNTGSGTF